MSQKKLLQRGAAALLSLLLAAGTVTAAGARPASLEEAAVSNLSDTVSGGVVLAKGDLDGDGKVTIADVMDASKMLARASQDVQEDPVLGWAADVTENGEVGIDDVMEICRMIAQGGQPGALQSPMTAAVQDTELWQQEPQSAVKADAPVITSGKQYILTAACSGAALTVENSSRKNTGNVQQWANTGSNAQRWKATDLGDGYFRLTNAGSGKDLSVQGSSSESGANVYQYTWIRGDWQKWKLTANEDGTYRIQAACAPDCSLDISSSSIDNGANAQLWTSSDSDAQKWRLEEVGTPQKNAPTAELADAAFDAWMDQYYETAEVDGVTIRYVKDENYKKDFWKNAEMFEVVLDACERSGNDRYKAMIDEIYAGFNKNNWHGENWEGNEFNDDIMWMVIACARAYNITGNRMYLDKSKKYFDIVYERAWDETLFGGGLFWKTENRSKNSCINGPATVAACLLGEALNDESYYDKAKKIYAWQRENLVNAATGQVYDAWNCKEGGDKTNRADYELNSWASTYNQGTWIGGCTLLYLHTGEQQYLDDAKRAADYTVQSMYKYNVIHNEGGDSGDLAGFKGILTRWLGLLIRECGQDQYTVWMELNAKVGWDNRSENNLVQTEWRYRVVQTDENNNYNPWGCSAFVALMQNCLPR